MVRIKHRYLLVHILYPDTESALFRSSDPNIPDTLRFHQPTPDAITPPILLGDIREHVSTLFGDYGAGVAGLQLRSMSRRRSFLQEC
jgi:ribonuclease P/MRP protein subunit POP5